jgi:endogenous inhibitor of DNA gyrase (YacG/DUF329 family)
MQQAMQGGAAAAARPAAAVAVSAQHVRPSGGGGGMPHSGVARGPACPVCGKTPMEAPHEAGCGHSACYACWLKALAQFKCPVCSRAVRKSQLSKRYFG